MNPVLDWRFSDASPIRRRGSFLCHARVLRRPVVKAHALAVVAVAKGETKATWIAAATLDRYLQRIGQAQIYGTQFLHHAGKAWTQEPYRRDLISDALRQATGVPPLAKQSEQLKDWALFMP